MKISKSILFFTTLFFINLNAQDIPPEVLERMPAEMKDKMPEKEEKSEGYESIQEFLDDGEYETLDGFMTCLLYTSPSPRDKRQSRMPSSA